LGSPRIEPRLRDAFRYYPTPPWADRTRREVLESDGEEAKSLLARVPGLSLPGVRVRIEDEIDPAMAASGPQAAPGHDRMLNLPSGQIVLTVTPEATTGLRNAASAHMGSGVLCLHAELDPEADTCLVWKPGSPAPRAISKPDGTGRRVAGTFLILVGEQTSDAMKMVEDGFSFLLTRQDFERVRTALAEGRDLTLPHTGAMPALIVRWTR
jgi:hypothetical protein